jgi:ABC-type phosphate/phosphonate transport system substrate-binding protein
LTILAQSPAVPSNGLCVRKDLDGGVKNRLGDVLVTMDKDPEGKEVLKKFEAMRSIRTTKEDYRPVFDIARDAGITIKNYAYVNQ